MNLYRLELKRVCKTRMTAILLAIALVLAVVMAYLPVTFIGWTELDASGKKVSYTGRKLLRLFCRPADRHGQHRRRAGIRYHHAGCHAGSTGSLSAGVPAV